MARRARPKALVVAVGAVAVEVLALVGVVVLYGVELTRAADPTGAVATAVVAAALAVGLTLCARALASGRRWARAPMLTWQLFQVVLTAPLFTTPLWPLALVFVLLAVAAGVCLASRPVSVWVGDDDAAGPAVL